MSSGGPQPVVQGGVVVVVVVVGVVVVSVSCSPSKLELTYTPTATTASSKTTSTAKSARFRSGISIEPLARVKLFCPIRTDSFNAFEKSRY